MLSTEEVRRFYDRFGSRQDQQGFYEDVATSELRRFAEFEGAHKVVELGCGTGRFAFDLLSETLNADAAYRGFDLSATMVDLARKRLTAFGGRADVDRTEGSLSLPVPDQTADRFVSTYVFDLLPEDQIRAGLDEAHRILEPGGLLALVSLTHGVGWVDRLVSGSWALVQSLRPAWVGGCRPIALLPLLPASHWQLCHRSVVTAWGIPSEVLVAERLRTPG